MPSTVYYLHSVRVPAVIYKEIAVKIFSLHRKRAFDTSLFKVMLP